VEVLLLECPYDDFVPLEMMGAILKSQPKEIVRKKFRRKQV
jgi:hypothetical protein